MSYKNDTHIWFSFWDLDSDLIKTSKEFTSINLSVSIKVVEDSEHSAESSDGSITSGFQLFFNFV